ncbi:MAG: deoxyribodipyrimidine photo-lyase [Candidatus Melainabacteria bacterium]|nr:deoxyribodipyrimidine photo-lyase [Candidatus Melainabacteria bacterium]
MGTSASSTAPVIVWFRQDLRIDDNPALSAAAESGAPVIPLFIWSPEEEGNWEPGAASRFWLHHSLTELTISLARLGSPLIIKRGYSLSVLRDFAKEVGAHAVYWSRRYEPSTIVRDKNLKGALVNDGVDARSFNANLLFEPWQVLNAKNEPYRVFTAFYKAATALVTPPAPIDPPKKLVAPVKKVRSVAISDLMLLPKINWTMGLNDAWQPGEKGAKKNLEIFLDVLNRYVPDRDCPGVSGTSRLSPHLHFGEISPRTIWHAVRDTGKAGESKTTYLKELVWREFAHSLLYHFPHTANSPLRPEFERFAWRNDPDLLERWQKGATGYPLIDAGMRELWHTGWMHNRVRMIVASFLVKDLLLPWQQGAEWFWDTLVDADLANNTLGWQWSAGCGADAAPYFRVFNPVLQSQKFDPDGEYIKRWVPELSGLPKAWIHHPWDTPKEVLKAAAIELGKSYPQPIVDHAFARQRALEAFKQLKPVAAK